MIRIATTGSECTGKTTLAEALGQHYGAVVVPEFARRFVDQVRRPLVAGDVEAIAHGQIDLERSLTASNPQLVILDTDLLSSIVYSRHYYGSCPSWIASKLGERPADLYLLCDIDVPWIADGQQRDRGDRRAEMHQLFRKALLDRGFNFVELRGSHPERLESAIRVIDEAQRRDG